jgi:peptide/nickel transport system ATP-binding protein
MKKIRGKKISIIFQQAKTALNPFMRIGEQITRIYRIHENLSEKEAQNKAIDTLRKVGIPDPEKRMLDYPHQLSGGMCQRVMIAMMTACNPDLLIADEPTTGLDVVTQAQILDLMKNIKDERKSSIILITHDLGIVAQTCNTVAVMHAGQVCEIANVRDIFSKPKHPYTIGLLNSIPQYDKKRHITGISGSIPSLINISPQCRFSNRCEQKLPKCDKEKPQIFEVEPGHHVMCHLFA